MYSAKKDRKAAIHREIEEEREIRELARSLLEHEHFTPLGHRIGSRADLCRLCQMVKGTYQHEGRKARTPLRKER